MRVQASKITNVLGKELGLHFTSCLVLIQVWPDGKCYLIYNGRCVNGDAIALQFPTITER